MAKDDPGYEVVSGPGASEAPAVSRDEKPPGTAPGTGGVPGDFPRGHFSDKDTPVAVLGFSGSGKTVYLTMLYYATSVNHSFPEGWEADFLILDPSGKTDNYLKDSYKKILGIGLDGKLEFQDPFEKKVKRDFPKGTDDQEMLQFALSRATGVGDHVMKVKTLDVKGGALRRFAAKLPEPTPEELARDPVLKSDLQRWKQMRDLCERAGAILLFFNLLNWEGYDHTADVSTLIGLLLNQEQPPKALAFVVTGIDILKDESEVARRRKEIIKQFDAPIRKLKKRGVAWDVIMISNVGRGFTTKMEILPAGHPCSGKLAGHICNRCQVLVPNVEARPEPENLAGPWEFIYRAIRTERRKKGALYAALLFMFVGLPLGFLSWNYLTGWQQNQQLDKLLANQLTRDELPKAAALERELGANTIYRFFVAPSEKHGQLRRVHNAAIIYGDPSRKAAERLAAGEEIIKKEPSFAVLVPIDELKIGVELEGLTSGTPIDRIAVANKSLANPEQAHRDKVVPVVEKYLVDLVGELRARRTRLDAIMKSASPVLVNESEYVEFLRKLQSTIDRGEIRAIKGAADIRDELGPMIENFTWYADFVKAASMPDQTVELAQAKVEAVSALRRRIPGQHPLRGALGVLDVEVRNHFKSLFEDTDFRALPNYEPNEIFGADPKTARGGTRNFSQFAAIVKQYDSFVIKHREGKRVNEIRGRLREMQGHANDMIESIGAASDREKVAMKAQDVKRLMAEWEIEVARAESDLQALQDLTKIFDLPVAAGVRPKLEELTKWKRAALEVARVIAAVPQNDKQMEDQAKELAGLAQRLPQDVPARRQAQVEQGRLEDKVLANQLDEGLSRLPTPDRATVETPDNAFQNAIDGIRRFIETAGKRLTPPERMDRFQRFLADAQRRDPLKTAVDNRNRFEAKLAEKKLWDKIEIAQKKRDLRERGELLQSIGEYIERYPSGEKAADAQMLRQQVEGWRVDTVQFKVGIFEAPSASTKLTITVSPAGGGAALVTRTFPVTNRKIAPIVQNPGIEFKWNSSQDVSLEVIVTNGSGRELYKETRRIAAAAFNEQMVLLFPPRNGVNFKLDPKS